MPRRFTHLHDARSNSSSHRRQSLPSEKIKQKSELLAARSIRHGCSTLSNQAFILPQARTPSASMTIQVRRRDGMMTLTCRAGIKTLHPDQYGGPEFGIRGQYACEGLHEPYTRIIREPSYKAL